MHQQVPCTRKKMISLGSRFIACCKLAPTLAREMWRHNYVIDRNEYLFFTLSESSNPWVYSLQFLLKSTHHSSRYERKCEWVFFFWTQCICPLLQHKHGRVIVGVRRRHQCYNAAERCRPVVQGHERPGGNDTTWITAVGCSNKLAFWMSSEMQTCSCKLFLFVPRMALSLLAKAFNVSASSVWNSLSRNCHFAELFSTFIRNLKTKFFDTAKQL